MKSTCRPLPPYNDCECSTAKPKLSFTVAHNGKDRAMVKNQKGEDVTEYFNITFVDEVAILSYKNPPSYDEWKKIAGKK